MNIKEKFTTALNQFVTDEKQKPDVIGIFVTGSYVLDKLRPNSDLDLFIVTTGKTMQIMARYYNGIELECCYKPLKQYFYDIEIKKNDIDVQRFSNALILYDPGFNIEKIIELAKSTYSLGPGRTITESDLYHYNDAFSDLEDSINDTAFKINLYKCLEKSLQLYFKKNNLWQCKEKYYIEYIANWDLDFSEKVRMFLLENDSLLQFKILSEIKIYILSGIGKLDKNWKTPEIISDIY